MREEEPWKKPRSGWAEILLEHRDFSYRERLELPVEL